MSLFYAKSSFITEGKGMTRFMHSCWYSQSKQTDYLKVYDRGGGVTCLF